MRIYGKLLTKNRHKTRQLNQKYKLKNNKSTKVLSGYWCVMYQVPDIVDGSEGNVLASIQPVLVCKSYRILARSPICLWNEACRVSRYIAKMRDIVS